MLNFSKGKLSTIDDRILDDLYYWKYLEEFQAAKNGMDHILRKNHYQSISSNKICIKSVIYVRMLNAC